MGSKPAQGTSQVSWQDGVPRGSGRGSSPPLHPTLAVQSLLHRKPCVLEIRNGSINFFPRWSSSLHPPGCSHPQPPPRTGKGQMGGGIDPRPEPGPRPRRGSADQLTTRSQGAGPQRANGSAPSRSCQATRREEERGRTAKDEGAELQRMRARSRSIWLQRACATRRPGGMLQPAPSGHRSLQPEALNKLGEGLQGPLSQPPPFHSNNNDNNSDGS
jgi:hypothetical protein